MQYAFKSFPCTVNFLFIILCSLCNSSQYNITKGKLIWKSKVRPTQLSREYNIEIIYAKSNLPEVYVVGDELQNLDSKDFPHKYEIDIENKRVKLCLYRYYKEFSSEKLICETIIPWAIEWLYFYEIWLVTGEWQGGGEHPDIQLYH